MRSVPRLLAALAIFIGASLAVAAPAAAVPTVAFSVSSVGLTVGVPATYTADVFCDEEPCRYQWRWYRVLGNDRLGTTMGEGPELTYAFSTPGLKNVVLKVTNATRTHGFAVASQVLRVMTENGEEPPVDPTDPTDPVDPPVDPPVDLPVDPPVDEAPPVDEPPLPPVETTTPVDTPTVPATDQPTTPAADPSTPPATEPSAPPVDNTCPAPADPPAAAPTTEPAAPPVDPTCTAPVDPPADPGTAVTSPAPAPSTETPPAPAFSFGDDPSAESVVVASTEPTSELVL